MMNVIDWLDYYSDFFPSYEDEEAFIKSYLDGVENIKLLNVECGIATLSTQFASEYDVTITDKFLEYTNLLTKRVCNYNGNLHIFNLDPIDIARYLAKNYYSIIYSLENKITFMKDKTLFKKFLFDSKMLLKDNGKIIIGLSNFSKFDLSKDELELPQMKCSRATLKSTLYKDQESASYKISGKIITSRGKVLEISKKEDIIPLGIETIQNYAEELKFSSVEFFGDYKKGPYEKDSKSLICVLTK